MTKTKKQKTAPLCTLTTIRDHQYFFDYDPSKFAKPSTDIKPLGIITRMDESTTASIAVLVDDIRMAWHYMMDIFAEDQRLVSVKTYDFQPDPTDRDYWYDEDADEYKYATPQHFFDWLHNEFVNHGCVYLLAHSAYESHKEINDGLDEDTEYDVAVWIHGTHKVVEADHTYIYSAKYQPGTNMFYYTDGNRTLHSSRIDALVITKKSGYNPTVKYTMADGNAICEEQMATAEMAHEWINSKK